MAQIDARGAYRLWACASLVSYCVYELRLSEDEAQRRCRAARVARQFPILFGMVAHASIHLTGILLLAVHLTPENHVDAPKRRAHRRADARPRWPQTRKYGSSGPHHRHPSAPAPVAPRDGKLDALPITLDTSREPETMPPPVAGVSPNATSRHVPAALRRSVVERDEGRCTYVDSRGARCRETARLELDNIRLRCRAHNDQAAELDFGRAFMQRKKHGEPPSGSASAAPARK